jgi:hypothetical protein
MKTKKSSQYESNEFLFFIVLRNEAHNSHMFARTDGRTLFLYSPFFFGKAGTIIRKRGTFHGSNENNRLHEKYRLGLIKSVLTYTVAYKNQQCMISWIKLFKHFYSKNRFQTQLY